MILRLAIVASVTVLAHSGPAWAQGTANEGLGAFLRLLTERAEATFVRLPEITAYFTGLAAVFDLRTTLLLVAVVVVGLFVEWAARQLLSGSATASIKRVPNRRCARWHR
jgi:hypothetical protein